MATSQAITGHARRPLPLTREWFLLTPRGSFRRPTGYLTPSRQPDLFPQLLEVKSLTSSLARSGCLAGKAPSGDPARPASQKASEARPVPQLSTDAAPSGVGGQVGNGRGTPRKSAPGAAGAVAVLVTPPLSPTGGTFSC